ncbi:hypothetical protein [Planococcus sp. ISL-110]|nr:hypothetical protein [Planococcus sp. ISL-110]
MQLVRTGRRGASCQGLTPNGLGLNARYEYSGKTEARYEFN